MAEIPYERMGYLRPGTVDADKAQLFAETPAESLRKHIAAQRRHDTPPPAPQPVRPEQDPFRRAYRLP